MQNDPNEPLELDDDPPLRTNIDVETRRWILVPAVVVVVLLGVALVGSLSGGTEDSRADAGGDEPSATTTTERAPTGPRTRPIVDLATEVDVSDLPFDGALYTVGNPIQTEFDAGTLVRIDLSTGEVTRGLSDVGVVTGMLQHGDQVLVLFDKSVMIIDAALETLAVLDGQHLASRPGEIWTVRTDSSSVSALIRHDDNGEVQATIPADLGFVSGAYVNEVLHLSSGLEMWTIDDDNQVHSIESPGLILRQMVEAKVTLQCEDSALRCAPIAIYDGEEILLSGLGAGASLAQASWSGRFLMLFDPGTGHVVVDLEHPERTLPLAVTFSDSFAAGADLIVRREAGKMVVTDLVTGSHWRFELPNDVAKYFSEATLLVIPPG